MKLSEEMKFLCFLVLIAVVVSAVEFIPLVAARVKARYFPAKELGEVETVAESTDSVSESELMPEDVGIHPLN